MNILLTYKYLTLKSFNTLTEEGRADERYRLATLSMLSNLCSKFITAFVLIASIKLTIPYLGVERFGLWMTISSFAGLLAFLDFGFGNALTNRITYALAKNDKNFIDIISGGLGALSALAILIYFILLISSQFIPFGSILKFNNNQLAHELNQSISVFIIFFSLNMIVTGVQRVFVGMQKSFESHLIFSISSFISLLAIYIAAIYKLPIPYLLAIIMGAQTLGGLILIGVLFARRLVATQNIIEISYKEGRRLLKTGSHFFILQLAAMIAWGADSIMIASLSGVVMVSAYAVLQRLFQIATQPMSIFNAPLWASYADAHARDEKNFVRKTLFNSMISTLCYSIFVAVFLVVYGNDVSRLWTGGQISVSKELLISYGIWAVVDAVGNCFGMFLNGCNIIKPQIVVVPIFCILVLPAKYIFIKFFGLSQMIIALTLIYMATFLFFYGVVYRKQIVSVLT